ncbi:MAG: four helix bundle protein [Crocinitomicaceae bacterium]|nr:four helix bundle protein [Crocinitomicaceae bacterium]
MLHNYKELKIWQKSMELAKAVLFLAKEFPEEYKYSLTSQMTRSSISIPTNIAEGSARTTNKDFSRFLDLAQGSACELETQLILSSEIEIIDQDKFIELKENINEIQKMIRGFKQNLN